MAFKERRKEAKKRRQIYKKQQRLTVVNIL